MGKSESSTGLKHSDRISSLPEALHSKILSLLPTKDAVATSILSKRWKFVWTCITNLAFEDGNLRNSKFTQIVKSVLVQLNPSCIQNFTLRSSSRCYPEGSERNGPFCIQSLVCAAIERTIQKLELSLVLDKPMELPLSHFNCKTLTVLKLSNHIHFNVVASAASVCFPNLLTLHLSYMRFTIASNCSVSFPSLKDLHLDHVKYANDESVNKLFASCPVLNILHIQRWYSDNMRHSIISIPSLQTLHIHTDSYGGPGTEPHKYKLHIDTPALEYLSLKGDSLYEITTENLSCLAEVRLIFAHRMQLDGSRKTQESISEFIRRLSNVRFLSIKGDVLEAIGSISESIAPIFCNLTRLELGLYTCGNSFIVIKNLLEWSDNLEHLIIKGIHSWRHHASLWMEPLSVPMCLLQRVTTISFTILGCCSSQLEPVKYFLKNAKVLELMTINMSCSSVEKCHLMQKISMSPLGSRACQIEFR